MAHYKTITLELIHERPELYERLRCGKMLLPAMDAYATELRDLHQHWKERLAGMHPGRPTAMTAAEALELAIEDLQGGLPSASAESDAAPLSLDAAMSHIRRHTPPA